MRKLKLQMLISRDGFVTAGKAGAKFNPNVLKPFWVSKHITSPPSTYISGPGNIFDSLGITYTTGNNNSITLYQSYDFKPGTVQIIKLDSINRIISGTFGFSL